MTEIQIRKVNSEDLEQLQKIGKQTFSETFSRYNSEENMRNYLDEKFSDEKLLLELSNEDSMFYFAVSGDEILGYLKLNTGNAQTEPENENALEIERIYVLKEFHGKKVGQILYEKALQTAQKLNADYIWLGVWEENVRALHFYRKNGFIQFGTHIFRLGNDEQTDLMMKLLLKN